MKKFFSLIAAVLFAGSMMADSYTIEFKDSGSTSDSNAGLTSTTISDYVATGADYISAIAATGKVYNAQQGWGLKFGNSSNPGTVTLTLATPVKPTSIAITASQYGATEGSALLQDSVIDLTAGGGKGEFNDYTYEYDGNTEVTTIIIGTSAKRAYVKSVTVNYEAGPAPAVATPVIAGDAEFTDSVIVTITCSTPETDIYYTTDGTTDPKCDCAAAPEYKHEIVLKETTTIKAAAYTGNDWSAVAEKTFTKKEKAQPITCAEVYSKTKNDEVALNDVVVTYANGKNVYVKDATGAMLVYLTANTSWNAGDVLSGIAGTVDIYNNLYEVKPTADQVAAVTATPGEAPAPEELTKAPVAGEMNKFVLLKNVTVSAETFPSNKNMNCTIGDETFVLRNNFNADVAFDTLKTYDITGVVAVYNATVQVYFINAEEVKDAPVEDWTEIIFPEAVAAADLPNDTVFEFDGLKVAITDSENKMAIDGNKAYFGTADENVQYAFRLKTGGKSQDGTKKNFINITVPADGDLRLAVRSGNKDDETRNLVLVQEGDTIYNAIVKDADAIEVAIDDSTTIKVFPYITVPVKAGEIAVGYPVNSLNFYSFAFQVPVVPEPTYTVAGSSTAAFGTAWDPANAANDMELVDGLYTWKKEELKLAAGNIEFKVCEDHAWAHCWPAQNYSLSIPEDGIYTVTITFNPETKEIAAEALKTGDAVILPTIVLHGNFFGDWKDTEAFAPADDKLTAALTLNLGEGNYEFGFRFDGTWKANGANLTREANTTSLAEGSGNMKLAADQAGKYTFVYTFETQELVVTYPKPIQTYEVAEAIAAGLADDTEILVRGIITKMEIKGKNFAKYGSVNIYVADATGAEGEFEYYNCYSLEADTFRATVPEYDPNGNEWIQLEEASDANGNAIHVGDTVIALGKYKLFNEKHELNTGCYLVDIKHATPIEPEVITITELTYGEVQTEEFEQWGAVDVVLTNLPIVEGALYGDGYIFIMDIAPENANDITGVYSVDSLTLDPEYSGVVAYQGTDTTKLDLVDGAVAFQIGQVSIENKVAQLAVKAELLVEDGTIFNVSGALVVYYEFIEEQGIEELMAETENGKAIKLMHEGQIYILKGNKLYNVNGQSVR